MKTLHVETGRHLYGGAQQVQYLTSGLAARGHQTILVCPPESAISRAADGRVEVVELACGGDLDLRFAWRLRQLLGELKPELVHCHSRRGADFLGGRAAAMAGIPAVLSRRVDNRESGLLSALRYRQFDRVIAISRAIEAVLLEAGVPAGKLTVIRSAVDAERFQRSRGRKALCAEFGFGPGLTLIASAAQLIERKGQRHLLAALARLKSTHPGLRAVLFGRGPEERALRREAMQLGLGEVVTFAGFRDDLDDWLGAFDLLVHTALAEGLGVIALKAQAAGLPVVAFDAGGLAEAIVHEQTGLLVPAGDSGRLAAAISALVDDSARRDRYAANARAHVREHFSTAPMIDAHIALYESLIDATR